MAVRQFVYFKAEGEKYGTEFNPATDARLSVEEQEDLKRRWSLGDLSKAGWRTQYVGKVLGTYEKNGYNDSDFMAYVEREDGTFGSVQYGTTRFWTYLNSAEVDATDEVIDRYWAWREKVDAEHNAARKAYDAEVAKVGKAVTVTKGKHKGQSGVVGWLGQSRYGYNRWNGGTWRMRVDPTDGEPFFVNIESTSLPNAANLYDNPVFAEWTPQVRRRTA